MFKPYEQRQYPRDVWVLSPAYVVKQVTVVKKANAYSKYEHGDVTAFGKRFKVEEMHDTKDGAIAWGRKQIERRREYLKGQAALLDTRAINLDKAEAKA